MSDNKSVDIRGLFDTYEFPCKLPGSGESLLIRPLTTGQMKKILIYEDETNPAVVEDALDRLISECVITEGFDVNNLYLQDRFFLLLEIRKVSKGSAYNFNFKCPECGFTNVKSFSLDDLEVKEKEDNDQEIKINDKFSLIVDFPTRKDQKTIFDFVSKKKLKGREKEIETATTLYASCIQKINSVEGIVENVPLSDKLFILDNLTSSQFDEFKDWFEKNEFGVSFDVDVECTACDFSDKQSIPLSDFFV